MQELCEVVVPRILSLRVMVFVLVFKEDNSVNN